MGERRDGGGESGERQYRKDGGREKRSTCKGVLVGGAGSVFCKYREEGRMGC